MNTQTGRFRLCTFCVVSAEEGAEGFLDLAYGMEADGELLGIDALEVVLRDDDVAEAELLGLGNALFDTGHAESKGQVINSLKVFL